jgi:type 1 glutamine amidotransferase
MRNRFCSVLFIAASGIALAQTPSSEAARARETLGWRVVEARTVLHLAAGTDETEVAAAFERARRSGVATIVSDESATLESIEKLADRYGVNVAVRGSDPKAVLAAIEKRGARMGASGDLEQWARAQVNLTDAVRLLKDRLSVVEVHDANTPGLEEFIREVYRSDLKPVWIFDGDVPRITAFFDKTIIPIATYHREYGSRTAGIRRLAGPSDEERQLIEKAIPATAPATPRKPRKLLVVDLNVGRPGHPSIPYANIAVILMGEKTGAYRATFSNDGSLLAPGKLSQFDAVYLNNTLGDVFDTPEKREGFRRFIAEGGGLIANHAVTVTSPDWAEFGEILGARGASHRMTDEKVTIRVEDPASPINTVFGGKEFVYADEIFRFQAPYSREKVHVLLSVDVPQTDMKQGRCYGKCDREDGDYPISWIHAYGKGRVFYTTLGHNPYTFWNPQILRHFLAAIQYALGDLGVN